MKLKHFIYILEDETYGWDIEDSDIGLCQCKLNNVFN